MSEVSEQARERSERSKALQSEVSGASERPSGPFKTRLSDKKRTLYQVPTTITHIWFTNFESVNKYSLNTAFHPRAIDQ